jgi:hypothetical protein
VSASVPDSVPASVSDSFSAPGPYYCITHREVPWPVPSFMTMVGTGDYEPAGGVALSRAFPELAHRNGVLGEYAAMFAIRRILERDGVTGFVGTGQYRRFAVTEATGRPEGIHSIVTPEEFVELPSGAFVGDGTAPVIPGRLTFPMSLLEQHAGVHTGRDLLHYFAAAAECGVVTDREAARFLTGRTLIAMASVGYVPVPWFVQTMRLLEEVTDRFTERYYVPRQGDQERVVGWCCERLHGLLWERRIQEWLPKELVSHPVIVVAESGHYAASA